MTKELVIASSRHETKVAILEDDQLVEVYFQRANEYSLAGSIHKGRVTRVLPGMQSAFVDLGLDRDTFLYVSDFFEENDEEYERIQEDRQPRPPAPVVQPVVVREVEAPPAPPPPAAAAPVERTERSDRQDRDRDDGRGRRSRRRRGRGKGFPESKYASSEVTTHSEREEPAPAPSGEEEFMVLPGESLAKYQHPHEPGDEPEEEPREFSGEEGAEEVPETADELNSSIPEGEIATPDTAPDALEDTNEWPVFQVDVEEKISRVQPDSATPEEVEEASEPLSLDANEQATPAIAAEPEPEGELESEPAEAGDIEALEPDTRETQPAENGEEQPEAEVAEPGEGVEPARIPQSLTATLREQGGRYMHRVSRRMRRKMRGQDGPPRAEGRDNREPRDNRDTRDVRDTRDPRDIRESREIRDNRDTRDTRDSRDVRTEAPRSAGRPEKLPATLITDLLKEGQEIVVQIAKEPLGQKGARITSHIALPGRYVVYMPTVEHVGVSRKIASDEERLRLKRILQTHREGMPGGFIMRTAGEGRTEDEIAGDMGYLFNLWLDIRQKAEKRPAPCLLHHDLEIVSRVMRDQLTDSFKAIWVDNEDLYESVLRFVQRFQPSLMNRVKLYTRPTPIFDAFNITAELEKALRPKVWLKSGGYIVINQTEALVAIDVNTGKYVGKSNRLEDTIVKTNTEAVKEIVRQMRLRDLGGIIVIDFIDMDERKNRQKVMGALEDAMRADRAPFKVLQFNDFGLVAITRKRVKQSLERTLCSPCPYCEGAGYVKSVQTIIGEILQEASKLREAVADSKEVFLRVHPDVAKVLKSKENQYLEEVEETLGRPVAVTSDPELHHEKFDLA